MTSIVDDNAVAENAPGDLTQLEQSLKDAVQTPPKAPESAESEAQQEPSAARPSYIPEKFWTGDVDSSLQKMAEGYKNLESAYGRMANDLGTQRKITDSILLAKRDDDLGLGKKTKVPKTAQVSVNKLVENPTAALDEYFSAREAELLERIDLESKKKQMQDIESQFVAKHPDYMDVAQGPEFAAWIESSTLRKRAAALAAQGDYVVADELLTEFKSSHSKPSNASPKQSVTTVRKGDDIASAKRVATESAATSKASSKKIYRRADLIALRQNRPEVYGDPAFQEEIMSAYREGRVK